MPLIHLNTNVVLDAAQEIEIAEHVSKLAAKLLRKPEQWVMAHVATRQSMIFAGSDMPCAFVECKSIGMRDPDIPLLADALCTLLHQHLQLDPARIYIEFTSAQAHQWGWNGGTF
ncbi:MAG TPA: hypothetical protein ENO09_02010 [bacterium]|nr:hypothetical protein [bacterium]